MMKKMGSSLVDLYLRGLEDTAGFGGLCASHRGHTCLRIEKGMDKKKDSKE